MKNPSVLIIGYGVVGKNLANEISVLSPDIYDKFKTEANTKRDGVKYDVAFVCVDTPLIGYEGKLCDISQVFNAITENYADIYVIKSTVLPGTTEYIIRDTGKRVVFSPEYYGGTQHCNNFTFDFTVLGGEMENCKSVAQLLQMVYDGRHRFFFVDAKTAELAKYMENSYLATKVSFCVQFYEIAKKIGVDYEQIRQIFVADPRVNASHTFVYADTPYWQSHCLDKDVTAIAEYYNADLLKAVITFNDNCKETAKKVKNGENLRANIG
jgi:nucleotide sugar dehydrogenase